ncbi:MAG: glycoside hydrolase family 2 TIM barrel-domain containing protein [Candidatus Cryptobacteroides sp.]
MRAIYTTLAALAVAAGLSAQPRVQSINNDWTFSLGSAEGMYEDFTHGTEYFTYIAKARSSDHNSGPVMPSFDDSSWQKVSLPHDWAVDLPFSSGASHSHGYKCIGWKYPENSVGWYRKWLHIPQQWQGKRIFVAFDGIYRDSQVYVNGFYLGGRDDGYLSSYYELTDYIEWGAENLLAVRADASLEEGWFYEGAGIYRNAWLYCLPETAVLPYGVKTQQRCNPDGSYTLEVEVKLTESAAIRCELLDAQGLTVAKGNPMCLQAREWDVEDPYLYTLRVMAGSDTCTTRVGFRRAEFDAQRGFLLNGRKCLLKGCNLHQDHAGVGSGIPDELWRYRLTELRKWGFNAIRCSHNPASPAMLDLCDELGFLVIDENREFGSNERQLGQLEEMILRDINHPSIILWSVGNEEWALEWTPKGTAIAQKMCRRAHQVDPGRLCTYGNSGGRELVKGVDVLGYNYIVQNPVLEYHESIPHKTAVGTEETTGAGTRGKWETDPRRGWMQPLNRRDTLSCLNAIERGWKFYKENTWTCGLFYWTGIDYRGEPNPMVWPATGSQFGILDYCAYPKDEAWYLRSWWTGEPTLHICGPSDGEVWVYSNCPEVELFQNGKSLGRKNMPQDGHLAWAYDTARPAKFKATGRRAGQRLRSSWPEFPAATSWTLSKPALRPDGQDVVVIDIDSPLEEFTLSVEGAVLLGWGNGDPGFKEVERPQNGSTAIAVKPFAGKCQVLVRSIEGSTEDVTVKFADQSITISTLCEPSE